jgi:hypothetical protein
MFSWICVCVFFSPGTTSPDDSLPQVRQRIEELVADWLHRLHSQQVLSERNLLRSDMRDPVLLLIAQMLLENNWEYLYNCACPAFPRLVQEFYGHMIVIQDDDRGLIMQTMVRGQTIPIDPQLISSVIGVPVLPVSGVPFPDEAPSIDFLHNFFGTRPQRKDKSHSQIYIDAFALMHRFLAKVVVTNLWPQARWSELTLKKATLLYAIVLRTLFCLCKHILHTMLEVRDEKNTSLSFGCLITQICHQVVTDISDSEPCSRIPDPLGIHTLMKSNAQLRHKAQGAVPQPPPDLPTAAASSSQAVPPSFDIEATFALLMTSMSALQREVNLIGKRVEQSQIDIRECLKYHHPKPHDDDD